MDYKVLYRKYRPIDFASVYGQDYTVKILQKSVVSNKISHAYLFTGPRGTGKTSTAKIFAKAINCLNPNNGNPCGDCEFCKTINSNPDIIELDAASNNGVEEIRGIIETVRLAPSCSKFKVYIIDEVHMLTPSAFNALLLTLEEPPGNVVFILATTDVQKVPITILSRCQRFDFKPIDIESICNRIKYVVEHENIKIEPDAINEIAYISNGGLRDALSILDQLSGLGNTITLEDVYSNFGTVSSVKVKQLVDSFVNQNVEEIITSINEFKINGTNYVVLIEKIIQELRAIAIEIKCKNNDNYYFDDIYNLIVELNNCLNNSNININPFVLIELTILKYMNRNDNIKLYDFDKKKYENELKEEKNISREIKKEEKVEIKTSKLAEKDENYLKELIKIRVNNCFVDASKEIKTKLLSMWPEFLEYVDENFKKISSIMSDTTIGMASSQIVVLVTKKLSTADLINSKNELISEIFKELFDEDYKFICLSTDKWNEEMENYKNNKKLGVKYKFIEEQENLININDEINDETSDIDQIANDLFGQDVIEYE